MNQKIYEKAKRLLDQIIAKSDQEDEEYKLKMIAMNRALAAQGQSWYCFHLRALKELLDELDKNP